LKSILIVGAKSEIAIELATLYAKNNYNLYLAGRSINDIESESNELKSKYNISVKLCEFDIIKYSTHKSFYDSLDKNLMGVIIISGYYPLQSDAENDWELSNNTINVNYVGPVSMLNLAANRFIHNGKGFIVGITSVSGERGRSKNYIYGSSKAGLTAYLSGLRQRLQYKKINVLTVISGYVKTKKNKGLDKPGFLTNTPKEIANDIFQAQQKGKHIIYSKRIWKLIMILIKIIPEFIFKKLSI
tara:strand:+ start:2985 stop:3716 length:732 start_codon:yes stop_codon:yes gene_type:complete